MNGWLWLHLSLIFAGFIGLAAAVGSAVLYLWQSSQLKSKHPNGTFLKLPSLEMLDRVHFRALVTGVIFFSLGILTGFIWATDLKVLGSLWRDPRVSLSFLTCFLYWIVAGVRITSLRRGQKIAIGTLIVFGLLFITFISTYYAPSSIHPGF